MGYPIELQQMINELTLSSIGDSDFEEQKQMLIKSYYTMNKDIFDFTLTEQQLKLAKGLCVTNTKHTIPIEFLTVAPGKATHIDEHFPDNIIFARKTYDYKLDNIVKKWCICDIAMTKERPIDKQKLLMAHLSGYKFYAINGHTLRMTNDPETTGGTRIATIKFNSLRELENQIKPTKLVSKHKKFFKL